MEIADYTQCTRVVSCRMIHFRSHPDVTVMPSDMRITYLHVRNNGRSSNGKDTDHLTPQQ